MPKPKFPTSIVLSEVALAKLADLEPLLGLRRSGVIETAIRELHDAKTAQKKIPKKSPKRG